MVGVVAPAARTLVDVGSGAGLPGVVLGVRLPSCRVVLSERRRKRANFLTIVAGQLGLENLEVVAGDVAALRGLGADVVVAQAVGSFAEVVRITRGVAGPDAVFVVARGRRGVGRWRRSKPRRGRRLPWWPRSRWGTVVPSSHCVSQEERLAHHRRDQSEGRRGQDHDGGEPVRRPGGTAKDPPGRSRSPGQREQRCRHPAAVAHRVRRAEWACVGAAGAGAHAATEPGGVAGVGGSRGGGGGARRQRGQHVAPGALAHRRAADVRLHRPGRPAVDGGADAECARGGRSPDHPVAVRVLCARRDRRDDGHGGAGARVAEPRPEDPRDPADDVRQQDRSSPSRWKRTCGGTSSGRCSGR